MGAFFKGGERIQKGRGIGGVLRIASKLFKPLKNIVQKALSSETGKKVISSVKEQAIDSSINLAKDLASGKDLKRSLTDEMENVKGNAKRKAIDIGIDLLKTKKKTQSKTKSKIVRKRKKQKDIFD